MCTPFQCKLSSSLVTAGWWGSHGLASVYGGSPPRSEARGLKGVKVGTQRAREGEVRCQGRRGCNEGNQPLNTPRADLRVIDPYQSTDNALSMSGSPQPRAFQVDTGLVPCRGKVRRVSGQKHRTLLKLPPGRRELLLILEERLSPPVLLTGVLRLHRWRARDMMGLGHVKERPKKTVCG